MVSRALILAACLMPSISSAAVDCADANAVAEVNAVSQNPTAIAHTRPSGSDFVAIGFAGHQVGTTARVVTAKTWAGNTMTDTTTLAYYDPIWGQMFHLVNPPSGTNNFSISWNSDPLTDALVALVCTGVDQASPIRDQNTATGLSTTASVTVTNVQASDVVVFCVSKDEVTAMTGAGSLVLIATDSTPAEMHIGCWYQPGSAGGSASVTWTTDEQWTMHGVALKAVAGSDLGGAPLWFP